MKNRNYRVYSKSHYLNPKLNSYVNDSGTLLQDLVSHVTLSLINLYMKMSRVCKVDFKSEIVKFSYLSMKLKIDR